MADKIRLDILLFKNGISESREKAKALINSGNVFINSKCCSKAGQMVFENSEIDIKGGILKYVSRGGLKLEKAIAEFHLDLSSRICMDIGASTGGFTDCMLQNNAQMVFAVDVGRDQLAEKLRVDHRVVRMEQTNIRNINVQQIDTKPDFVTIDVSFISLTLVLPVVSEILKKDGEGVCLVKPQFEAGKNKVGKKGVVRELSTHISVCERIYSFLIGCGLAVKGITFSPIKGPEGNIEYLFYFKKTAAEPSIPFEQVNEMVESSHKQL